MNKKRLNITIISPSDVTKERNIIEDISEKLNVLLEQENVEIVCHLYKNYPPNYHADPQTRFMEYHALEETDMFIAILWYRIGTILPEKHKGKITNSKCITGTEYEIEYAISSRKPLWIYIKDEPINFTPDEVIEGGKQKERLNQFLKNIGIERGKAKNEIYTFTESEFQTLIEKNLRAEIFKRYNIRLKSLKSEQKHTNIIKSKMIDSVYYFGLYGMIAISIIILFQYVQMQHNIDINIVNKVSLFSSVSLGVLALAVRMTPVSNHHQKSHTFKEIANALMRRMAFILISSVALSVSLWFTLSSLF